MYETTQKHEKVQNYQFTRRGELAYSPWRARLLPVASKHCSLSRIARGGEQATRGGERNRFSVKVRKTTRRGGGGG